MWCPKVMKDYVPQMAIIFPIKQRQVKPEKQNQAAKIAQNKEYQQVKINDQVQQRLKI